ncbi:MAG: condensation domain-containing protein, partial [Byssovorax sp.]
FHSYAFDFSVWEIWGALLYGGRLVVVPYWISRAPDAFYKLLGDEQVTVLNQTPSAFRQLIFAEHEAGIEAQARLALRYVVFGGEALDLADLKPFWDRHGDRKPQLVNMYGITETTVHVTYRPVSLADLERPWSSVIGCPIPDLDVYIVDGRRNLVPIGVPGEMLVGGAGVSRGYLRRPELTAERFFPDTLGTRPGGRLYKTGDLARYLPNGDVEYLGRIDHQVKIRGFRIELGEIEAVLEQHAAVREAIVLAREDGPGEKRLIGYLVCAEGQGPTVGELRAFLKEKLPEYMVPAAFVLLDRLPLTSNGKVDRQALPAPEAGERLTLGESFVAPRSPAEEALSLVWAQVLRLPKVGIHDNFFELGGDSILSIQIVWRAADAGVKITPRQLFQHQTIAELAEVAGVAGASTAEQGPVTGEIPLTPIAHWWLEQKVDSPSHYNQAYFLEVREALDPEAIAAALGCLIEHHDALRVRLDGGVERVAAIGEETPFQRIALHGVPEEAQKLAMEQTAADVQASLDLERGPALRAVLFDLGPERSNRLLLVIHHLACDGVSWRILFDDLWTAYEQRRRGEAMSLPAKTTSFKQWAEKLTAHAASDALTAEGAYWTAPSRAAVWRLPVDHDRGENTEASQRAISLALTEEETDALLRKVPEAYRTQINDVLLSAVALSLTRWTGAESVLVDLEGHGREEIFDDVDLTRTVGWFTTVFPVLLDVPGRDGPGEVLTSVKEQLRAIPGKGLGYGLLRYLRGDGDPVSASLTALPQSEVSFNYLGQLDQAFPESSPLRIAPESVGPSHSLRAKRRYRLDVRSSVTRGKLWIRWAYSENQYRAGTIEALSARVMEALRELIAHCLNPEAGGYTPSDFEKANLSREDLDDVMDSLDLDDEI